MSPNAWGRLRRSGAILVLTLISRSACAADVDAAAAAAYFDRLERDGFSGAVLIEQHGRVLLRHAYGLANDAARVRATPDTVFDLGSITKHFTATAVLLLSSEGRLNLDDRIDQFFPDVPPDKAAISVRDLLTHSSGLTEHSSDDREPLSRADALKRIFASRLAFAPGHGYHYSNSGYTIAAAIVEVVSGVKYTDFVRDRLFAPLHLESTGFYGEARFDSKPVAHGYFNGIDEGSSATWPGPYWGPMGNGELLSTVDDLATWHLALRTGAVIPRSLVEAMFTPQVSDGDERYGYGWSIETSSLGHTITHNGGGIGGNADVAWYPEHELLIIVLSNRIDYRVLGSAPFYWNVRLPATEARAALAESIASGDYARYPSPTWPWWNSLAVGCAMIGAFTLSIWAVIRMLR